jgi:hypothetical protein
MAKRSDIDLLHRFRTTGIRRYTHIDARNGNIHGLTDKRLCSGKCVYLLADAAVLMKAVLGLLALPELNAQCDVEDLGQGVPMIVG